VREVRGETLLATRLSQLAGFGAAILWIALGAFLIKCSAPHEYGKNSGESVWL
jgi:hypothetical protein